MQFSSLRKRLLKQRRFRAILISLVVLSLLLGLLIVPLEKDVGNIRTSGDGIWWAVTTATTVGFGDLYPVTPQGRVIGMVLEVMGAVMFGVLIAIISSSMNRSQEEYYWSRLFERVNQIETHLRAIERQTGFIVKDQDHRNEQKRFVDAITQVNQENRQASQIHDDHQNTNK